MHNFVLYPQMMVGGHNAAFALQVQIATVTELPILARG